MTWRMRAVLTRHIGLEGVGWMADALGVESLGPRLDALDWSIPCVRWTDVYLPSSRNGSRCRVSHVEVWHGGSAALRRPEAQRGIIRRLSYSGASYGLVAMHDAVRDQRCASAYWHGHRLEHWESEGTSSAADGLIAPDSERAVLDAWLLWIAGAEIFELDAMRVEGAARSYVYALPEDVAPAMLEPEPPSPRSMAVLFVGPEKWEHRGVTPPAGCSMRWDETLGRGSDYNEPYLVLQGDRPLDGGALDDLCQALGCDAAAAQVGEGDVVQWWDWSLGFPGHCGQVEGVAEFVQVWSSLCQRMRVPPASFVGLDRQVGHG